MASERKNSALIGRNFHFYIDRLKNRSFFMQKHKNPDTFETPVDCMSRFETPLGGKMITVQTGKRGYDVRKRHYTAKYPKPHPA